MAFASSVNEASSEVIDAVVQLQGVCVRCKVRLLCFGGSVSSLEFIGSHPKEQALNELVAQEYEGFIVIDDTTQCCAVCVGVLQDVVLDDTVTKLITKIKSNPYQAPDTVIAKINVSLPVNTIVRDFAISAHLLSTLDDEIVKNSKVLKKSFDQPRCLAIKDVVKNVLLVKLNEAFQAHGIDVKVEQDYTIGMLELSFEFHQDDETADAALLDIQTSTKRDRGKKRWKPTYKKRRLDGTFGDNFTDVAPQPSSKDDDEDGGGGDGDDAAAVQQKADEDKARMAASVESGRSVSRYFEQYSVLDLVSLESRKFSIPPEPVASKSAFAKITVRHDSTNLLAKYHKFSRELSQTRWIKGNSVEELAVAPLLDMFGTKDFKFSSAGREDADVRMLGEGRHFVIQFQDPHKFPDDVKAIEDAVNSSANGLIRISHVSLHYDDSALELLKDGEESKRKKYRAVIWVQDPAPTALQSLPETPFQITQDTPIRVAHRRSLLERPKMVHGLSFQKISTHFYLMDIDSGAGMYIKEFVHGDRGRTVPSVADFFGCHADILQLDVLDIVKDEGQ
eukprot:TRINITY_DN6931_c0_g1_i2.p1 TRINITY_DN6931_c0_g1~~TRINITY_DN6931_c0_g1_i2.p1  ORF type:complete len:563 (+),score=172.28 TRINITY_DN6931_c0_g1_i2:156-1844(+)